MRHVYTGFTKDANGMIIQTAVISVYLAGTTTEASVYTSSTSATAVNSVTSDDDGKFTFYVDTDDYEITQPFKLTITKAVSPTVSYGTITVDYVIVDVPYEYTAYILPRMTTAVKAALSSPAKGMIVYDTTLDKLSFYNGSEWQSVTSTSP